MLCCSIMSERIPYYLLEVTFQSSPIVIKHRFTKQSSEILYDIWDCAWDCGPPDFKTPDEWTNITCWKLECWEHASRYGGSPKAFEQIMTSKGLSHTTWLQNFIDCYQFLPHTWKKVQYCVVKPYTNEIV